ncbi:MAG: hypothetical protein C0406_01045 [Sideroxydans sp.]|nr:hypothetical protein [Sideroxydans sp.]
MFWCKTRTAISNAVASLASRRLKAAWLLMAALSSMPACAEETLTEPPVTEPLISLIPQPSLDVMDVPRDYVSEQFTGFVGRVDRFFGDDRHFQESNKSVLQLDLTRVTGYNGDGLYVLSGRAKLDLPNTEERLHLTIESDADQNLSTDQSRTQQAATKRSTVQSIAAALRFERMYNERWHFSTDTGLQFQGTATTPFTRARGSVTGTLGSWHAKASETVFWFNTIGAGETTRFDFERLISEPLLFRISSNATWLHDRQNFDLRQDFSLFHTWDERTALLYQASALGISKPQTHVTDYVFLVSYRYRLHRDWLFFELDPQLHFPAEKQFHTSPALVMRLEMLFNEAN